MPNQEWVLGTIERGIEKGVLLRSRRGVNWNRVGSVLEEPSLSYQKTYDRPESPLTTFEVTDRPRLAAARELRAILIGNWDLAGDIFY